MGIQFLWKVRKRQRWDEGLNKQIKTIQNLKKRHYKYVSFTWFYFLSFKFYMCFLFYLYIFFDLQLFQFKKEKKMQLFLQWYDVNLYNILLKQLLSTGKVLIPKFIHASSNKWVYTPRRHRLFFWNFEARFLLSLFIMSTCKISHEGLHMSIICQ